MWIYEGLLAIYCLKALIYLYFLLTHREAYMAPSEDLEAGRPLSVDIALPVYNEEKVIVTTIENLLNISCKDFSIIVVDDGSTDQSYKIIHEHFGDHPRVRILHQQNAGKSSALNRAMEASLSDIIICIDADTLVNPDIIDNILPFFRDEKCAAVSGYIKVGNRINLLTDIQSVEYITTLNHERSMFEGVNGILVVPGALGAFRRTVVAEVGGFLSEALAEDCDITLRMLCRDYVVRNASGAVAFTEAPATLRMFFRQRIRWTTGLVQGLLKHRKGLGAQHNKALSCFVLPYTWLYRVILPLFTAFADYYLLYSYFYLDQFHAVAYYLSCILIGTITSLMALMQTKERINILKLIITEATFRHLIFITYLYILARWFNGSLYGWDKIPRQGNVKVH